MVWWWGQLLLGNVVGIVGYVVGGQMGELSMVRRDTSEVYAGRMVIHGDGCRWWWWLMGTLERSIRFVAMVTEEQRVCIPVFECLSVVVCVGMYVCVSMRGCR